jgi:peptide/nickel transport system substrate-binding protein
VGNLQQIFSDNAPAIPLFPGPQWNEYNTMRFTGYPTPEDPYTIPSTYSNTERLIQMLRLKPVTA